MAKYGRKIKRSKNLYKKRKGRGRKALEIAVMIVIIGGLGLVGFAAGRPLLDFIFGEREVAEDDDGYKWTPSDDAELVDHDVIDVDLGVDTEEPVLPPVQDYNAIFAPSSVLDNITSLAAYIRQAQNNGFNAVILDLKDSTGHLYYLTAYEPVQNTDIMRATLTATQITDAFENTGVVPVARLNATLDSLAPRFLDDASYVFMGESMKWMDNRADAGGKFWLNPFLQGTRDYLSFLVGELSEAGFGDIILANVMFPFFTSYDRTILDSQFTNVSTRTDGLLGLVQACAERRGSARLILEMSLKDIVENYAGFNATAELLRVRRDLDNEIALLLVYFRGDFGAELRLGESSSVILPADMFGLTNLLLRQAMNQTGAHELIPALVSAGLSDSETAEALRAFGELGFDSFAMR
jgi:hypothetical protein